MTTNFARALVAMGALLLVMVPATAQQRIPRIGVLEWSSAPSERVEALMSWLGRLGYRAGETIDVHVLYSDGNTEKAKKNAAVLAGASVQVIVAVATPAGLAAKNVTSTIPIIALSADPIGAGLLANLSRPEGNVTGISNMMPDVEPKRIEILREFMPGLRTLGYLASSRDPLARNFVAAAEVAARAKDLRLSTVFLGGFEEIEGAIESFKRDGVEAMLVQPLFTLTRAAARQLSVATKRHGMPAIASFAYFPQADGLVSYGPDVDFNARAAAQYIDQLLRGAKVADLPVQQPTNFHLSVNMRTAQQLGLAVPASILVRADEVIE